MTKKINLKRRRYDWEPPPGPFDAYIPILIVLSLYYAFLPLLRSCQ